MIVRLHTEFSSHEAVRQQPDEIIFPLRPRSFSFSLAVHAGFIAGLMSVSISGPDDARQAQRRRPDQEPEKKVLYLSLRDLRIALTPHRPEHAQTAAPQLSRQTIVTSQGSLAKTLVHRPDRPEPLIDPPPLPNLLALSPPRLQLPASARPPAPPKPTPAPSPKAFQPPPLKRTVENPQLVVDEVPQVAPGAQMAKSNLIEKAGTVARPTPKTFVAPSAKPGRSTASETPDLSNLPSVSTGSSPATLNMAVIGMQPSDTLRLLPPGSQQARIAVAGVAGPPTKGPQDGLRVPGVDASVQVQGKTNAPPNLTTPPGPSAELVSEASYVTSDQLEMRKNIRSFPLAQEKIPAYVREQFPGRHTYLHICEKLNPRSYSGDWLIWFAEHQPLPGDDPHMQAPIPFRVTDPAAPRSRVSRQIAGRVRLAGLVRKSGFVDQVRVVASVDDHVDTAAVNALRRWAFQPARRSGIVVEVDILVEIPFDLRPGAPQARAGGGN